MVQLSISQYGSIEQTKNGSNFFVFFGAEIFNIRFCEFLLLHRKLSTFSIEEMLADVSDAPDNTRLVFEYGKKKLTLSLIEMIRMKELFEEAMFTLRLHDVLYRSGISALSIEEHTIGELEFV